MVWVGYLWLQIDKRILPHLTKGEQNAVQDEAKKQNWFSKYLEVTHGQRSTFHAVAKSAYIISLSSLISVGTFF